MYNDNKRLFYSKMCRHTHGVKKQNAHSHAGVVKHKARHLFWPERIIENTIERDGTKANSGK